MISGMGWAALALLFGYLALFFWGSALAAQAAGRPVWLFARATKSDRLAATQVRSEDAVLHQALGSEYDRYTASVPSGSAFAPETP